MAKKQTQALPFHQINPDGTKLFQVAAGVEISDALRTASMLLSIVKDLTTTIGMLSDDEIYPQTENDPRAPAWAAFHLAEMANSVIDACTLGMNAGSQLTAVTK